MTAKRVATDAVRSVYSYWCEALEKARAKDGLYTRRRVLSEKRDKAIRSALREFSIDELRHAIDGLVGSDYHMKRGRHADRHGPRYDDIALVCRDPEHVEVFIDRADEQAKARAKVTDLVTSTIRSDACPKCRPPHRYCSDHEGDSR